MNPETHSNRTRCFMPIMPKLLHATPHLPPRRTTHQLTRNTLAVCPGLQDTNFGEMRSASLKPLPQSTKLPACARVNES